MASAAFKSTSKRGGSLNSNCTNAQNSHHSQNPTIRRQRSQSVSAVSRAKQSLNDISSEFSNKRENPLFWAANSTISTADDQEKDEKQRRVVEATGTTAAERGRSVTRNSSAGLKSNGIGRSLSRVRGRSVSRGRYGSYESDKEQELVRLNNAQQDFNFKQVANNLRSGNTVKNGADRQGWIKSSPMPSNHGQATECSEEDSVCSFQFSNWEDGISTCSLSETEEKTIIAVCEQMKGDKWGGDAADASGIYETVRSEVRRAISNMQNDIESAIRRGNVNGIVTADIADIPPLSVNSGSVESVLDIRREYAQKLEESEERARKLRADLAVEEHRGQEFSRILKETLPDPRTSNPQKSRAGRKRSTERKKISKCLAEEAMAYFDECVSISTFDSSDFSASEDPSHISAGSSTAVHDIVPVLQGSLSVNLPLHAHDSFSKEKQTLGGHGQLMQSREDSNLTAHSSSNALTVDQVDKRSKSRGSSEPYRFSFAQKPKENTGPQNNITNYVKHFERGLGTKAAGSDYTRTVYDTGEFDLHGCLESFLFERVFFRKRVESGSLHLCGGSGSVTFSSFGSVP
ncbi:uncharacterized protein LOC113760465 [Coffea eugenioides]|uniref:uncharacterized protein LOC113760465 n=1 Tax=Coffea eugenioides TaxID=49369 RepID=UPI000F60A0EE|nr:uncharacterized protein LOC113760465 [Coffea eugenioides]